MNNLDTNKSVKGKYKKPFQTMMIGTEQEQNGRGLNPSYASKPW